MSVVHTPSPKDQKRLDALLSAQKTGIIHWAALIGKSFHVKVTDTSNTKTFTGTQVDAFLFGVRVGQLAGDKEFTRLG